ncbi:Rrf2 family transcriptional regulator [Pandoraea iniqua]|uniref:Rrf2 family transcriptional regulator n=1 Tax=Pandoraea iniqua TaxID=2508288 RepID=A0A5E4UEP5_9BURK|nr:Rrf2 family transcriptional regulator [Pandoraea iniqua]VVD98526.1 Rrf2 family transcriptional regulator [Pandoraea iniqua]
MRLTDYTDYSLRTLIYVAVHPDELVHVQAVADAFDIPKNHLVKIVQKLGQLGFLHTVRGRAGGIRLGRAQERIGLGEVVRAMEPDFALVECFHQGDNACVITSACHLKGILGDALRAYFAVLDRYTLADLVNKPAALRQLLGDAVVAAAIPVSEIKVNRGAKRGG